MKKIIVFGFFLTCLISCKSAFVSPQKDSVVLKIDTLLTGQFSIRALVATSDTVWFAANKNSIGMIDLKNKSKKIVNVTGDSLKMEFRSLAQTKASIFVLNVGNPALLYKFSRDLLKSELVYQENNPKVFYDSMQFWNDKEGIAIGDPITNCLSVIVTRDGGATWYKIPCNDLPVVADGEAAFAASNTNIIVKENTTWVVSGGKKARVFYSPDKAKSWSVFDTPIVQGESMTGIFTADFYNAKIGMVAGGNFEKPSQNFQNKACTTNGGKTWKLVSENSGFGYASCLQFVPETKGNELVCVGHEGLFYSKDKGESWQLLLPDSSLYTLRFIDKNKAIAAGKGKIIALTFTRR